MAAPVEVVADPVEPRAADEPAVEEKTAEEEEEKPKPYQVYYKYFY